MSLQNILDVVQQEIKAAENFIVVEMPKIKALGTYLDNLKPGLDVLLIGNPKLKAEFDEFVVLIDKFVALLPTETAKPTIKESTAVKWD